jgi:hypothetical protein
MFNDDYRISASNVNEFRGHFLGTVNSHPIKDKKKNHITNEEKKPALLLLNKKINKYFIMNETSFGSLTFFCPSIWECILYSIDAQ